MSKHWLGDNLGYVQWAEQVFLVLLFFIREVLAGLLWLFFTLGPLQMWVTSVAGLFWQLERAVGSVEVCRPVAVLDILAVFQFGDLK